jgi:serine/threonine protein kinase
MELYEKPKIRYPTIPRSYRFVRFLSAGSYGVVEEYENEKGQPVAVKTFGFVENKRVYGSSDGIPRDALREMQTSVILKGTFNTANYSSFSYKETSKSKDDTNVVFSVFMTLYDGDLFTLAKQLNMEQRVKLLPSILYQTVEGLYELHSRSLIHRDIKNDNIFYKGEVREGRIISNLECFLGDFGLSRHLPCDSDVRAVSMSSPVYHKRYRAPEIVEGQPYSEKADVWALGVTLLTWTSGEIENLSDPLLLEKLQEQTVEDLSGERTLDSHSGYVSLRKWFKLRGNEDLYYNIPSEMSEALEGMLHLNPHRRKNTAEICQILENACILTPITNKIHPRINWSPKHPQITVGLYFRYIVIIYKLLENLNKPRKQFAKPDFFLTTLDILDRYMSATSNFQLKEFHETVFTSILITGKLVGPFISVDDLSFYSSSEHLSSTKREIVARERQMTTALGFIFQSCETDTVLKRFPTSKSILDFYLIFSKMREPILPCYFSYSDAVDLYRCKQLYSKFLT